MLAARHMAFCSSCGCNQTWLPDFDAPNLTRCTGCGQEWCFRCGGSCDGHPSSARVSNPQEVFFPLLPISRLKSMQETDERTHRIVNSSYWADQQAWLNHNRARKKRAKEDAVSEQAQVASHQQSTAPACVAVPPVCSPPLAAKAPEAEPPSVCQQRRFNCNDNVSMRIFVAGVLRAYRARRAKT